MGADFVDYNGSLQLLISSHLRERYKMLLRAILCGGAWNGFLRGQARKEDVPCRFCGAEGWRWSSILGVYLPPILHVRELPESLCFSFWKALGFTIG